MTSPVNERSGFNSLVVMGGNLLAVPADAQGEQAHHQVGSKVGNTIYIQHCPDRLKLLRRGKRMLPGVVDVRRWLDDPLQGG